MNELLVEPGPATFSEEILPHLDAAHNLARWLVRNSEDAEDIVQEACLRALRFFDGFRGGSARAWLLRIVRNTSYKWLQKNGARLPAVEFDESIHTEGLDLTSAETPETLLIQSADRQMVERALRALPVRFREMLVLRELQGLTYREISEVTGAPMGTVMSSLSRARDRFRQAISEDLSPSLRPEQSVGSA